ncbi:MAG: hypothetical protein ACP5T2_06270, partial [Thermoprotei archaeon]
MAFANVITTYDGGINDVVVNSPIIPWLMPNPCLGNLTQTYSGFNRALYGYTLETTNGYQLSSVLADVNTTALGSLSVEINGLEGGEITAYEGMY